MAHEGAAPRAPRGGAGGAAPRGRGRGAAAGAGGERGPRPEGGAPRAPPAPGTSLYVGNLSWYVSWQDLKDAFTAHGATYADVKYHPDGRSKGWGIVRFTTADEARAALAGE